MKYLANFQRMGLVVFLLIMVTIFHMMSPYFLTWENITNIFTQSTIHIVLAIGMTLVISTGGIDLSCGSILALSAIIGASVMKAGLGAVAGISIGLLSGGLMGLINAIGIASLSISPFIVTLGTAGIYRALALILTEARPIYGLPLGFRFLGNGWVGLIPVSVIIALVTTCFGFIILNWTGFGTNAKSLGDNEEGAFRMGISIFKVRVGIYCLAGMSAALAGIIMSARLNTAEAIAGLGIELEAIAAVVIGGTSFSGGEASIFGALLGALIIGTLANGLTIINVPSYYQQLVIGLVFMLAVLADQIRRRHTSTS